MDLFRKICLVLLIIGGLNWGLVGVLQFDLVAFLFGSSASLLSRIVYTVIGVSALVSVTSLFMDEK